ncbi:FAD-binding oxidoreductase [Frigidibacter oleivorans]|uniref:FAD-binding oxidoreductase n=1 Tax=Frigidibacter oleivorans TaxID=2487129 RepID=UPI000F8F6467|nr:FAD-binding oxidoreductase [Frigidibacter oleivorans]
MPHDPIPAADDTIGAIRAIVGERGLVTDAGDAARYLTDWTGRYTGEAIAVVRPASTEEVSAIVRICAANGIAITPQGGNTGIAGGATPHGNRPHILLSLDRMRSIRNVDKAGRTATVDAGVVLQTLQEAIADDGLIYPLMFGARGSCTIGGNLATNAGGSNVLRYGNARALCIGIEAVMADGSVVSDLSGLRKDNTGYDLRDLLVGSEGTLGVITAATVRLFPAPVAVATAFLSLRDLDAALVVLNRLQDVSGGLVEAFEYMPAPMIAAICDHLKMRPPVEVPAETGILLEIASSRPGDAVPDDSGMQTLQGIMLSALEALMEEGLVTDALIASSEQQRQDLWRMRESVGEIIFARRNVYMFDIALPLARVPDFIRVSDPEVAAAGFLSLNVAHLGDGNLHYAMTSDDDAAWTEGAVDGLKRRILERVREMGGSFSAEHGIGRSKLDFMRRYRTAERLAAMQRIKSALDPADIMNPGKTIPAP